MGEGRLEDGYRGPSLERHAGAARRQPSARRSWAWPGCLPPARTASRPRHRAAARCAELHKAILAVKTSAAAGAGLEPDDLNAAVVAALTEWSEGYARTVVDAINEHLFKLLSVQWKDVQSRLYNGAYVRGEGGQVVLKRLMRKIATLAVPMYKEAPRAIADALSNTATAEPAQSSDDDDAGHDVLGLTEQLRAVPDKVRAGAGGGRGGRAGRGRAAKPTTHPRSRRSPRRSPSRALLSRPA